MLFILLKCFWGLFFRVRLLSVLRGHSVFSSPPQRPMTSHFEGFYTISYPLHYSRILILESQYFPNLLNKGNTVTTGTSLVWHGPWLGIAAGTSCTRSQHSTTRLSRKRLLVFVQCHVLFFRWFWAVRKFYIFWKRKISENYHKFHIADCL